MEILEKSLKNPGNPGKILEKSWKSWKNLGFMVFACSAWVIGDTFFEKSWKFCGPGFPRIFVFSKP